MHKYQVIFVFLFVCSCFVALGQTNVSGSFGALMFRQKGGFDHSEHIETGDAAYHFNISHFKANKYVGFAGGMIFGRVNTSWYNPLYFICQDGATGESLICQSEAIYRVQANFNSFQLSAGPAVRVGQFLEFAVSPFLGIHSR